MGMADNATRNRVRVAEAKESKPKKSEVKEKVNYGPRLRKIFGLFMIGVSIFLFFSFLSYLFSWQSDQSLVTDMDGQALGQVKPQDTANWMGIVGAWASDVFIRRWFGLSSFLFIPFLFLLGYRILFEIRKISLYRLFSISFFFIVYLSVLFAFTFHSSSDLDYAGGTFGFELQTWIRGMIGAVGLVIMLAIAFLSFLVVMVNLSFRIPSFSFAGLAKSKAVENFHGLEESIADVFSGSYEGNNAPNQPEEDVDDEEFEVFTREEVLPVPESIKGLEPEKIGVIHNANVGFEVKIAPPKPHIPLSADQFAEEISNTGSWYKYPHLGLLRDHHSSNASVDAKELQERKNLIVATLENYKITIDKIEATIGPTVTLYEIIPSAGIRISKIKSLEDDIALSLSALGIRIIAPMPGKGTIGIEVPNQNPEIVSLKEAFASEEWKACDYDLPVILGKTISNKVYIADLAKMPHLLMAGATGQGKSVGINTLIASILYKKHPEDVKFIMIDPKKVELSLFKKIEKHFLPELPDEQEAIITDTKMVVDVLKSLCVEMDDRYDRLKDAQVRNIKEYNKKIERGLLKPEDHKRLPYIILVIDELADLMMTAGKEVELPIARLAQLARAIGIHLIVATQRPSVNIITGTIKANFPARLAFRVTSNIDSRTILDSKGAEQLIGRGDMLYSTGNDLIRVQCPFIDTDEVEALTQWISEQPYPEPFKLKIYSEEGGGPDGDFDGELDPMFEDAARLIVNTQQGSTSLLQRRLKLGYNRAGRLMDQMERVGIVGINKGSVAREVLIGDEMALEQFLGDKGYKN
jgi:S-DNA-T family DNA segregation ATPase FtsK/SpoIIIE